MPPPPRLPLCLCLATAAGAARAQTALPSPAAYERPAREAGEQVIAPTPRVVPPAERALTTPDARIGEVVSGPRWGPGAAAGVIVATLGVMATMAATRADSGARGARARAAAHPGAELRRVTVALTAAGRAAVEARFADAASRVDPATPAGLHALLTATRDAVSESHRAIVAGAFQGWSLSPAEAAQGFDFASRSVRTRAPQAAMYAPPGSPQGFAAVTLVVLARSPLPALPEALDTRALLAALDALVPLRAELLVRADLAWTPPERAGLLYGHHLEELLPELLRVADDPQPRRACGVCRCVYTASRGRCLACGAS